MVYQRGPMKAVLIGPTCGTDIYPNREVVNQSRNRLRVLAGIKIADDAAIDPLHVCAVLVDEIPRCQTWGSLGFSRQPPRKRGSSFSGV